LHFLHGRDRGVDALCQSHEIRVASHPQPRVGYQAGPGYDAMTGFGVPNGAKLLAAL
jgi:hypothetical protein